MNETSDGQAVRRIVAKHRHKVGGILAILHELQALYGYLPREALRIVSETTGASLVDIYGLVTFYNGCFTLAPPEREDADEPNGPEVPGSTSVVRCPRCNHSLMDPDHPIAGQPSVRVTVAFGLKHGWFRFCSRCRTYAVECEHEFPLAGQVNFFCPHCHTELLCAENCSVSGAPMVPAIQDGGMLRPVCSLPTCACHRRNPK